MPLNVSRGHATTVRDRLISAADDAFNKQRVEDVTIDSVAAAAQVPRTTAYRHLGTRQQLIAAVALRRSDGFVRACEVVMAGYAGTFAKLEAAFVFVAREMPRDPILYEFFVLTPSGTFSPEIFAVANDTLGPILEAGRRRHEVRTDISTSNVLRWLIEQLYLAVLDPNHTKAHVMSRVRRFVVPALSARPADAMAGSVSSHLETLNGALAQALDTVSALRTVLPDPNRTPATNR